MASERSEGSPEANGTNRLPELAVHFLTMCTAVYRATWTESPRKLTDLKGRVL
jgi:hypothetical protein